VQVPDNANNWSAIEEKLIRRGALRTQYIHLQTQHGIDSKLLRVFRTGNAEFQFDLVFRITDKLQLMVHADSLILIADDDTMPANVVITEESFNAGEIEELYLTTRIDSKTFERIAYSESLEGIIDDMNFQIPYECREEWREIAGKRLSKKNN
jgi:hypothetical protein